MANVNEKVRIPKEVAEAIEYFRRPLEVSNDTLIEIIVEKNNYGPHSAALVEYAKDNFETLVKALYIGYEIEQPPKKITLELTPEELGTIYATYGITSHSTRKMEAVESDVPYLDDEKDSFSLYMRIKELALEEARV